MIIEVFKENKNILEKVEEKEVEDDSSTSSGSSSSVDWESNDLDQSDKIDEIGGDVNHLNVDSDNTPIIRTVSMFNHDQKIIKWEQTVTEDVDVAIFSPEVSRKTLRARRIETEDSSLADRRFEAEESSMGDELLSPIFVGNLLDDSPEWEIKSGSSNDRPKSKSMGLTLPHAISPLLLTGTKTEMTPTAMRRYQSEKVRRPTLTFKVKKSKTDSHRVYINQYMLLERIGRGSSSTVRRCKDITTGDDFAMKILNKVNLKQQLSYERTEDDAIKRSSAYENVEKEIAIMTKLAHKNIVNLIEVIDSEKMVYLVLEYLPAGSIAESSATIDAIEDDDGVLRLYMRDMVSGLAYLHSQRICHSDIKPENILIGTDGVLKLADFGLSKFLSWGQSRKVFNKKEGTPAFQAPECLNDSEDVKFSLVPTDVWALGVTLYQLKYGKLPFFSNNEEELALKIRNAPVEFPEVEDRYFVDLIRGMLEKDPSKRITVKELCQHSWITDGGKMAKLISDYELEFLSPSERSDALHKHINFNQGEEKSDSRSGYNGSEIRPEFVKQISSSKNLNDLTEDEDDDEDDSEMVEVPSGFRRSKSVPLKTLIKRLTRRKDKSSTVNQSENHKPSPPNQNVNAGSKSPDPTFEIKLDDGRECLSYSQSRVSESQGDGVDREPKARSLFKHVRGMGFNRKGKKRNAKVTFNQTVTIVEPGSPPMENSMDKSQ